MTDSIDKSGAEDELQALANILGSRLTEALPPHIKLVFTLINERAGVATTGTNLSPSEAIASLNVTIHRLTAMLAEVRQ